MKGSRRFPVLGTGHADCRNSPRVTQGNPRSHYPPVWRPRAPTPSAMGRAEGPAGAHPRPACLLGEGGGDLLTGPAVQVQMDPFDRPIAHDWERRAARAAGGTGDLAGAAASRLTCLGSFWNSPADTATLSLARPSVANMALRLRRLT
jgi:hypothetical protein